MKSVSSFDSLVSAYSSISTRADSLTVILVNRSPSSHTANVSLAGFTPATNGTSLRLASLSGETFVSHTQNALQRGTVSVTNGAFSTDLPVYSVTAYQFARPASGVVRMARTVEMRRAANRLELRGGPDAGSVALRAPSGIVAARSSWRDGSVQFDLSGLPRGVYFVDWAGGRHKVLVASR